MASNSDSFVKVEGQNLPSRIHAIAGGGPSKREPAPVPAANMGVTPSSQSFQTVKERRGIDHSIIRSLRIDSRAASPMPIADVHYPEDTPGSDDKEKSRRSHYSPVSPDSFDSPGDLPPPKERRDKQDPEFKGIPGHPKRVTVRAPGSPGNLPPPNERRDKKEPEFKGIPGHPNRVTVRALDSPVSPVSPGDLPLPKERRDKKEPEFKGIPGNPNRVTVRALDSPVSPASPDSPDSFFPPKEKRNDDDKKSVPMAKMFLDNSSRKNARTVGIPDVPLSFDTHNDGAPATPRVEVLRMRGINSPTSPDSPDSPGFESPKERREKKKVDFNENYGRGWEERRAVESSPYSPVSPVNPVTPPPPQEKRSEDDSADRFLLRSRHASPFQSAERSVDPPYERREEGSNSKEHMALFEGLAPKVHQRQGVDVDTPTSPVSGLLRRLPGSKVDTTTVDSNDHHGKADTSAEMEGFSMTWIELPSTHDCMQIAGQNAAKFAVPVLASLGFMGAFGWLLWNWRKNRAAASHRLALGQDVVDVENGVYLAVPQTCDSDSIRPDEKPSMTQGQ